MKSRSLIIALTLAAVCALSAAPLARAADEGTAKKAATTKAEHFGGRIESIDIKAGTLTIKHKETSKTFVLNDQTKYGNSHEKNVTSADFKVGEHVSVMFTKEGGKLVAEKLGHIQSKEKAAK